MLTWLQDLILVLLLAEVLSREFLVLGILSFAPTLRTSGVNNNPRRSSNSNHYGDQADRRDLAEKVPSTCSKKSR